MNSTADDNSRQTYRGNEPVVLNIAADRRLSRTDVFDDYAFSVMLSGRSADHLRNNWPSHIPRPVNLLDGVVAWSAMNFAGLINFGVAVGGDDSNSGASFAPAGGSAGVLIETLRPSLLELSYHPVGAEHMTVRWSLACDDSHCMLWQVVARDVSAGCETAITPTVALRSRRGIDVRRLASGWRFEIDAGPVVVFESADAKPVDFRLADGIRAYGLRPRRRAGAMKLQGTLRIARDEKLLAAPRTVSVESAIERHRDHQPEEPVFELGDRRWNLLCRSALVFLRQLLMSPAGELKHPNFMFVRGGSQGPYGDLVWWMNRGQHPNEAETLIPLAVVEPQAVQGVMENFYDAILAGEGRMPFLLSCRSTVNEKFRCWAGHPVTAHLGLQTYRFTGDRRFLEKAFRAGCLAYRWWLQNRGAGESIGSWLSGYESSRDDDKIYDTITNITPDWIGRRDVSEVVEGADLGALLYLKAASLAEMAQILGEPSAEQWRREAQRRLALLEELWNEGRQMYLYRDRRTRLTHGRYHVLPPVKPAVVNGQSLSLPFACRLKLRLSSAGKCVLKGVALPDKDGKEEPCTETLVFDRAGTILTSRVFVHIEQLLLDAPEDARLQIETLDFDNPDAGALYVLWAGAAPLERARRIIEHQLLDPNRFWLPNGIPTLSRAVSYFDSAARMRLSAGGGSWICWGTRILRGLCQHYGMQRFTAPTGRSLLGVEWACEMLGRMLDEAAYQLAEGHAFMEAYDSVGHRPCHAPHYIWGADLLLLVHEVLGAHITADGWAVTRRISGFGDRKVSLRCRGICVTRSGRFTEIVSEHGVAVGYEGDAGFVRTRFDGPRQLEMVLESPARLAKLLLKLPRPAEAVSLSVDGRPPRQLSLEDSAGLWRRIPLGQFGICSSIRLYF